MNQVDKAGTQYWDNNWTDANRPILFSEENKSLDNYVNIQLHEYFKSLFGEKKNLAYLKLEVPTLFGRFILISFFMQELMV